MARFCFYCGRELASGEKCNCRVHQATGTPAGEPGRTSSAGPTASGGSRATSGTAGTAGSSGAAGSAGSAGQAKAAGSAGSAAGPSNTKAKAQKKPSAWAQFKSRQQKPGNQKKPGGSGFRAGKPVDRAAILAGLLQIGRYLARPVESIRQSVQYANPTRLLVFMMIHAALGGIAAVVVSQLGTLDLMLQMTVVGSGDNPVLRMIFLFFQGAGLTLTLDLLLILITHLALQYVFRTSFSFSRLTSSFVPVIFYLALFLLLAIFSLSAIPISSLMMMAAGLAVSTVALYLALRQLTNFEDNRCFVLVTFILVVFTSILAMVISLAMPVFTALLDQTLPL